MNEPKHRTLRAIAVPSMLAVLFIAAVMYRVKVARGAGSFDPADPVAFYWTENALQYHFAELVAEGEKIPVYDAKLQAPEGVLVFDNLTILMEYPAGFIYRLFKLKEAGMQFHLYTIIFMAIWSSLTLFAVYAICRSFDLSRPACMLASALSVFSMVSLKRSVGGFLNEDFALPLFITGLAFLSRAFKDQHRNKYLTASILSGVFFSLSLAAWHLSRFLYLGLILSFIVAFIFTDQHERRLQAVKILGWIIAIPVIASLIVPVLRSKIFFLSPAVLLGAGLVVSFLIARPRDNRTLIRFPRGMIMVMIMAIIVVMSFMLANVGWVENTYEHVWRLLFDKIRFLGMKPAEPSSLSFTARTLWIEAFNSPHPRQMILDLFPLFFLAAAGAFMMVRKKTGIFTGKLLSLLTLMFFVLYLMVERMAVIANIFLSIMAMGVFLTGGEKNRPQGRGRAIAWILSLVVLSFNFYHGYKYHEPTLYTSLANRLWRDEQDLVEMPHARIDDIDLIDYLKEKTPTAAIVISRYGVGPVIYAYADRAIALQPKFEVAGCQGRVQQYLTAIYGSERSLYDLCTRWNVDYFIYDTKIVLDNSFDSDRWTAGRLNLPTRSAAFMMHFLSDSLMDFTLLYQNPTYRVFKVGECNAGNDPFLDSVQPVYELDQFGRQPGDSAFFNDQYTASCFRKISQARELLREANDWMEKAPARALGSVIRSRALYPGLLGSASTYGIALILAGRENEGLKFCRQAVAEHPLLRVAQYDLAYALAANDSINEAKRVIAELLKRDPMNESARTLFNELNRTR